MAEVEVTLEPETKEQTPPVETSEEARTEQATEAAEEATEQAEETEEHKETAQTAAKAATEAAQTAQAAASQAAQEAFLNESVLRQIKDLLDLTVRKAEMQAQTLKETREMVEAGMEEVRQTLELWQAEIGAVDQMVEKLGLAVQALVKIEQAKQKA